MTASRRTVIGGTLFAGAMMIAARQSFMQTDPDPATSPLRAHGKRLLVVTDDGPDGHAFLAGVRRGWPGASDGVVALTVGREFNHDLLRDHMAAEQIAGVGLVDDMAHLLLGEIARDLRLAWHCDGTHCLTACGNGARHALLTSANACGAGMPLAAALAQTGHSHILVETSSVRKAGSRGATPMSQPEGPWPTVLGETYAAIMAGRYDPRMPVGTLRHGDRAPNGATSILRSFAFG